MYLPSCYVLLEAGREEGGLGRERERERGREREREIEKRGEKGERHSVITLK
jgi:hypothetical protein